MPCAGKPTRVLFVCLGNICRSPTAEGVFAALIERCGLTDLITIDSCGTSNWHTGKPPDPRATTAAAKRGYDISHLRARQVHAADFESADFILAMDHSNLQELKAMCPDNYLGHLGLFLSFARDNGIENVPDPYYGGAEGFAKVLSLIEAASEGLLHALGHPETRGDDVPAR